jgi:curved DNA-binding protein
MAADLYQELGVSRSASADEIKRAYRKLAAKLHPDKHPGDKKIEERFKALNNAHQVLSDPKKRKLYDEFGEVALREGFDPEMARGFARGPRRGGGGGFQTAPGMDEIFGGGGGFSDMLGDLLRGRGRGRAARPPMETTHRVAIEFADAISGSELRLSFPEGPVTVRIPKGAADGDRVRVSGSGPSGSDVVLLLEVKPHPYFEREGLDLHLELPITVAEAYGGAKVRIPTPEGDVSLAVPKRAQSGQKVRLRGRGVRRKDEVGDLYVKFLIRLPDKDEPAIEHAVEVLGAATDPHLRKGIRW